MTMSINNHLMNNLSLSIVALLCSYGLWNTLSRSSKIIATIPAAIYFYNTSHEKIQAPESINITVYGKRSELKNMLYTTGVHIDAQYLKSGTQNVMLTQSMFDIPKDTILVNYNKNITISMYPIH